MVRAALGELEEAGYRRRFTARLEGGRWGAWCFLGWGVFLPLSRHGMEAMPAAEYSEGLGAGRA